MEIRKLTIEDYQDIIKLWKICNLPISKSDSKEEIEKFIKRNTDTSLVGIYEDRIISSVLGGFDGRRGYIYHLAVDPRYQRKGYGSILLTELKKIFKQKNILKYHLFVQKHNVEVVDFYKKFGCELREDLIIMSKFVK